MLRFIPRKLVPKLFALKAFAENMEAPRGGLLGRLASELMQQSNRSASEHAVDRLQVQSSHTVVELGPGNGWGIRAVAKVKPARLVAVEISEQFRNDLVKLSLPVKLELHGSDARDMSAFLPDDSVDRLLAVNVVYFLDPLPLYVKEIKRVMKPGGRAILACKRTATLGHPDVFKNKDIKEIVRLFGDAGFTVTTEFFDLGGPALDYTSIDIVKPETKAK